MKNTRKLLAAVAVSAFLAVSASAFAAETTTTTTTTETVKTVHHKHHHMAHHKAVHNKMACKQDRNGKCLHFFNAMGRGDDAWMGTRKAWQNVQHD